MVALRRARRRLLYIITCGSLVWFWWWWRRKPDLHLVFISDQWRTHFACQVVKAAAYYTTSHRIHAHFVVPPSSQGGIENTLRLTGAQLYFYNHSICETLVKPIKEYSHRTIHTSALCKLYLHEILPPDLERALYIDTDTTVLSDLGTCVHPPHTNAVMSMAVDLGDACQLFPQRCWPLAFSFRVPEGLKCGNVPFKYNEKMLKRSGAKCVAPGEEEPAQVNGGVILLELDRMRNQNFSAMLHHTVTTTIQVVKGQKATWGDQDFLNALPLYYPDAIEVLPCGCNYQWQGVRREAKCGKQPIVIAHGWSTGVTTLNKKDIFNRMFYYFLDNPEHLDRPPITDTISPSMSGSPNVSAPIYVSGRRFSRPHVEP